MKAIAHAIKIFLWEYIVPLTIIILTMSLFCSIVSRYNPKLSNEEVIKKQLTYYQGKAYFIEKFLADESFIVQIKPMPIPEMGTSFTLAQRTSDGMLFNVLIPVGKKLKPGDEVFLFLFQSRKTAYSQFNEFLLATPKTNNLESNHALPKM